VTRAQQAVQRGAPAEVRFKLIRDYLIVLPGYLGPRRSNFLLDTGASPSVVDVKVARELGLHGQAGALQLLNGTVRDESATLPELRLGPIHKQALPVVVRDLSFIQKELGIQVDATIGLDVIGQTSFSIDYRERRLLFGPAAHVRNAVSFHPEPPFIAVELQVQRRRLRLLVDTGTPGLTLFRQRVRGLDAVPARATAPSQTMAGPLAANQVLLSDVRLGAASLGPQVASVVEDATGAGGNCDGLIGPAALRVRRVRFDFERSEFGWGK